MLENLDPILDEQEVVEQEDNHEVTYVEIQSLSPHPKNHEIYTGYKGSKEDLEELASSIKEHGILVPITVTQNGVIISGNRRTYCARLAGLTEIPAVIKYLPDEEFETTGIQLLIEYNRQRKKTTFEIMREIEALKVVIEAKKAAGEDVVADAGYEKTRDYLGDQAGMSGRSVSRAEKVMEAIENEEDPDRKEELTEALNKSVSGAERLLEGPKAVTEKMPKEISVTKEDSPLEIEGDYFYLPELQKLHNTMTSAYTRLKSKRNGSTPKKVGDMIGNIMDMANRLGTWFPEAMTQCTSCEGSLVRPVTDNEGNLKDAACTECVRGKIGLSVKSEN